MTSFRSDYKRSQPLLGTFFTVSIAEQSRTDQTAAAVTEAFNEARRLEKIFSLRLADSEINYLNDARPETAITVSSELFYLLQLAEAIWRRSDGAFRPFLNQAPETSDKVFHYTIDAGAYRLRKSANLEPVALDLNGIAKGYIIDRTVSALLRGLPGASGVVNVGGDLRFFNTNQRCVSIRMGSTETGLARSLLSDRDGVATSSPAVAARDSRSTTRYPMHLRDPLTIDHTVVAMANCATIADSLTKVALFGRREAISSCARSFGARVLLFDPIGRLVEEYGAA